MTAQEIVDHALRTGEVWLGGEMSFPLMSTYEEAFERMCIIAENCGYAVWQSAGARISVAGGDIAGTIYLDWHARPTGPVRQITITLRDDVGDFPREEQR